MHVGGWFNFFAIKLNKLANILRTMYRLLHLILSVGVYCFAFPLLTSQVQLYRRCTQPQCAVKLTNDECKWKGKQDLGLREKSGQGEKRRDGRGRRSEGR